MYRIKELHSAELQEKSQLAWLDHGSQKDKENQLPIKLNDLQEKLCSSRNDHNLLK